MKTSNRIYFKHLSYQGKINRCFCLQKYAVDAMNNDDFTGKRNSFMSKLTFNNWWAGHCHKRLDKGSMDIVKSFFGKYEFNKEYFV